MLRLQFAFCKRIGSPTGDWITEKAKIERVSDLTGETLLRSKQQRTSPIVAALSCYRARNQPSWFRENSRDLGIRVAARLLCVLSQIANISALACWASGGTSRQTPPGCGSAHKGTGCQTLPVFRRALACDGQDSRSQRVLLPGPASDQDRPKPCQQARPPAASQASLRAWAISSISFSSKISLTLHDSFSLSSCVRSCGSSALPPMSPVRWGL